MSDDSIFHNEERVVRKAMELLASDAIPADHWPAHYEMLLQQYSKLLNHSQRLVRISDTMQKQLMTLSEQLEHHRDAAERANRAKSRFLAMISHDIRTPMNAVLGMTELLMQTESSPERLECLNDIKTSADALLTLLNDILYLSRIEAGRLDLASIGFDLWDWVGDTVRTAAIMGSAKGLELASYLHRDVPCRVVGDPDRLRQILMNLQSNAVKFTERGEIITRVHAESRDQTQVSLHFAISDTGEGIPVDRLESIFLAFEQADRQISTQREGTGLGLAICAKLVQRMGGRIWVESEIGKGSTFHFTVRLGVAPEEAGHQMTEEFQALHEMRALVIDDNAVIRDLLTDLLREWGMIPTSAPAARSGYVAMKEAHGRGKPFDVVLIDSIMPEIDGFELVRQIRQDPDLSDLNLMLLTAPESSLEPVNYSQLGIASRLREPAQQRELLMALRNAFRKPCPTETDEPAVVSPSICTGERALRILLAEDNRINRKVAVRLLEKMGHSVSAVENGLEVLHVLKQGDFDLLLMDIEMPHMNGLEATRTIREREATTGKHIPIVAMTAHAMEGDREQFLAAGMDGYVSKPISFAELLETIERMM